MKIKLQKNWQRVFFLIGCALILFTGNLSATTAKKPFKLTIDISKNAELILKSKNSSVVVKTSNEQQVKIEAEIKVSARNHREALLYLDQISIATDYSGNQLTIQSIQPNLDITYSKKSFSEYLFGSKRITISITIRLWVPKEINLNIFASKGTVEIENIIGRIHAETTEKPVKLFAIQGAVIAYTTNSDIHAQLLRLESEDSVELSTTDADIHLELPKDAGINMQATAYGGKIKSEFKMRQRGPFTENTQFGWINGGGVNVRLFTTKGTINIKEL